MEKTVLSTSISLLDFNFKYIKAAAAII